MNESTNYIPEAEPEKRERSYNWKTAIGLQDVDRLTPSNYLIETANANIEGKVSLAESERLINEYYERKPAAADSGNRTEEADKVAASDCRCSFE